MRRAGARAGRWVRRARLTAMLCPMRRMAVRWSAVPGFGGAKYGRKSRTSRPPIFTKAISRRSRLHSSAILPGPNRLSSRRPRRATCRRDSPRWPDATMAFITSACARRASRPRRATSRQSGRACTLLTSLLISDFAGRPVAVGAARFFLVLCPARGVTPGPVQAAAVPGQVRQAAPHFIRMAAVEPSKRHSHEVATAAADLRRERVDGGALIGSEVKARHGSRHSRGSTTA